MPDQSSSKFAAAHKALRKAADANPEWFDRARDVLKRTDDGSVLLLHALLEGLKEAYDAGRAGKPMPPLKLVQPIANAKQHFSGTSWRDTEPAAPAMPSARVARRPVVQAAPARRPVRGAKA